MLLLQQPCLNATQQLATNAQQRLADALSRSGNSVGNLLNAEIVAVTVIQKLLIFRSKSINAAAQPFEISIRRIALGRQLGSGQGIEQFFAERNNKRMSLSQKIANFKFRRSPRPRQETAARLKRVKFAPQDHASRLEQIIGVGAIADQRENIAVQLPLITGQQLAEQVVLLSFAHAGNISPYVLPYYLDVKSAKNETRNLDIFSIAHKVLAENRLRRRAGGCILSASDNGLTARTVAYPHYALGRPALSNFFPVEKKQSVWQNHASARPAVSQKSARPEVNAALWATYGHKRPPVTTRRKELRQLGRLQKQERSAITSHVIADPQSFLRVLFRLSAPATRLSRRESS